MAQAASAGEGAQGKIRTETGESGTAVHLPEGLTKFALEFGTEVVLAAVFALVVGLVLKNHVARALRESLDTGIENAIKKLSVAMPAVATEFAAMFNSAIQEGALPYFREQVSRAVEGVITEVRIARTEFQIRMVDMAPPKDAGSVIRTATELREAGRWVEAEQVLKKAAPADFAALQELVTLYIDSKPTRSQDALSALASAHGHFGEHPKYFWLLATVHIALKDREPAIEASKTYVRLCREQGSKAGIADALISLGYCYFWFEDLDRAIESTEEAWEMLSKVENKAKYVCQSNLAYYLAASRRDKGRALRLAKEAVEYMDGEPLSTDTMGYVRMQFAGDNIDELVLAREDFLKAAQADPSLDAAYGHLAEVDGRIGRIRKKGSR
jgi:tetratricopeptide (TPR) repeat protein